MNKRQVVILICTVTLILGSLSLWTTMPSAAPAQMSLQPQRIPAPTAVVYSALFHHVADVIQQADETQRQGKDASSLRSMFQEKASLSEAQARVLDTVATGCVREVAVQDARAQQISNEFRLRFPPGRLPPGVKLPPPPPELSQMQEERDAIVFAQPKKTQENASEAILQRKVPGSELEFLSTRNAFHSSLWLTNVPGGMATVVDCEPDTLMQSWKPSNAALGQVLDTLVATDPRYRWQMQDGVVNLLSAMGEPALLKTRLNQFDIKDVASAWEALSLLLALPEVKQRMRDLQLKPGIAIITGSSQPNPPKTSVKQHGGTLRQALNAIALAQGRAIWEYTERHCDNQREVVIRF